MREYINQEIQKTLDTIQAVTSDEALLNMIEAIAQKATDAIQAGGKLIFAGNGGSAADSQHLAAEIVSRLSYDRPAMAAVAITTDTSALTAIGNDYGYEGVFSRQIEAIGNKGDIFIAISTSGKSPNIIKALVSAREKGLITVGFTGKTGGNMHDLCDYIITAPSNETPKIQESHIMIGHIICALVEEAIHGETHNPNRRVA